MDEEIQLALPLTLPEERAHLPREVELEMIPGIALLLVRVLMGGKEKGGDNDASK